MKILIAGATGYLGSHLVDYLADRGHTVGALYRDRINPVVQNTGSVEWFAYKSDKTVQLFKSFQPDAVVNLAGSFKFDLEHDSLERIVDANLSLPLSLISSMGSCQCRTFIQAGTYWQSLRGSGGAALNPYTAAKDSFEIFAGLFCEQAKVNVVSLRIYDSYGSNDPRPKLLNLLLDAYRNGSLVDIECKKREIGYVHVSDICRAFALAITNSIDGVIPKGFQVYSLPPEKIMTLENIISLIENTILRQTITGVNTHRVSPLDKVPANARVLPGWIPQIGIENGLRDFFRNPMDQSG